MDQVVTFQLHLGDFSIAWLTIDNEALLTQDDLAFRTRLSLTKAFNQHRDQFADRQGLLSFAATIQHEMMILADGCDDTRVFVVRLADKPWVQNLNVLQYWPGSSSAW